MIPRVLIDTVALPGGGDLRLIRRGADFSIMLGGNELMSSRVRGSEEALATLSCDRIADVASPELLIGGLGMGFTLRAALAVLGRDARVTVAELLPTVIDWAHGPLAEIFGDSLADPRVRLVETDVAHPILDARSRYDAILLDVDNGPDGLTIAANDRLYGRGGLDAAWRALRPGGVLAIWSAGPDSVFANRLRRAGFAVDEARVRAAGAKGAHHIIWFATRPRR